ncbi:hypothetical protein C8244_15740 [Paracidovorax avenae]|nr:hypothetical protein C8234_11800 [Paracidovorax avenae]AVS83264.1 hypothetical protein C8237_15115 [Paracidovorax avenae]AVT18422.1 hypothetical protein C8244_15740 [Paracidovorax avenae]
MGGLPGLGQRGLDGVEAALSRVAHHIEYGGLRDVFGIAALYAEAIARGHAFADGNKRTALTCALTYLQRQGFIIPKHPALEEIMVELAERRFDHKVLADAFFSLARQMEAFRVRQHQLIQQMLSAQLPAPRKKRKNRLPPTGGFKQNKRRGY